MNAEKLISVTIPPVKITDTIRRVLVWMNEFHVRHLPVLDGSRYVGILSEEVALNENPEALLKDIIIQDRSCVHLNEHIFEVMKIAAEQNLTLVPVLDDTEHYKGSITLEALLKHFAQNNAITEEGAIITLSIHRNDYSLSALARIIEAEDVHILSSQITQSDEPEHIHVALKLDSNQIAHVIAALTRHGYHLKETHQENDYLDTLQERYDAFMNYLNI